MFMFLFKILISVIVFIVMNLDLKSGNLSKTSKSMKSSICGLNNDNEFDMQTVVPNIDKVIKRTGCYHPNDVTTLYQKVDRLTHTLNNLEHENRIKDNQLKELKCDNEKLLMELKKQQRSNRNLKQQLDDERHLYQKEKDHFREEMHHHRVKCAGSTSNLHLQQQRGLEKMCDSLQEKNKQLRLELYDHSETIYNLCIKFLRMRDARDTFRQKLDRLFGEHLQVMVEMMEKLDEARQELNIIVSNKFQHSLPLSRAKLLQVIQRNSRLVYENATLKLHIQQLTQNLEKFKNQSYQSKVMNVDTTTIAKLSTVSLKHRTGLITKTQLTRQMKFKKCSLNVRAKGIHSAPGIIERTTFRQARFSDNFYNCHVQSNT